MFKKMLFTPSACIGVNTLPKKISKTTFDLKEIHIQFTQLHLNDFLYVK